MSRFSPSVAVQDRSGEILAQALSQTFADVAQRRRQKQMDAERTKAQDEQRAAQDLTLALQGIHRGPAPMEGLTPQPVLQGGQITGVTAGPKQFTQLTPGFYRDERFVNEQATKAREQKLADALFTARIPQMADPEGFALGRRRLEAEVRNLENPNAKPIPWQLTQGEQGTFQVHPYTGESRPVLAGGQQIRPRQTGTADPNWTTVQTDQGVIQVNPKTGTSRPVTAPDGGVLRGKAPAQIMQAVSGNRRQLKAIDDTIALLRANPNAVGLKYSWIPDEMAQKFDPDGAMTRAGVSDVGSLLIHDRTGAAMNAAEAVRLKPFIPGPGDQHHVAIQKLERLKQLLAEDTEFLAQQYGIGEPTAPSLTPEQIQRAQGDPEYRQFLIEKGHRF